MPSPGTHAATSTPTSPPSGDTSYTEVFAESVAEAEQLIVDAPHVRTDQDLTEGLQYLAGSIAATIQGAWAPVRTHPTLMQGTG
ncbi:MAG: hypothetical protein L0H59_05695, partial [Tomitella sp.]|nr:hypothetical protein [Tomitella sp.]